METVFGSVFISALARENTRSIRNLATACIITDSCFLGHIASEISEFLHLLEGFFSVVQGDFRALFLTDKLGGGGV